MPNRFQRNSIGELVCHVPLNRGSLLKSIENLVKTIETSENAVMIPTLLRDKVRVDAWELLFVAKILKASILGHDDLVEFYMNHIHQNNLSASSNATSSTLTGTPTSAVQTPAQAPPASQLTPNGLANTTGELPLSPSMARHQSNPSMALQSPLLLSHSTSIPNGSSSASALQAPPGNTLKSALDSNPQDPNSAAGATTASHSVSNHTDHSAATSSASSSAASTISTTVDNSNNNNNNSNNQAGTTSISKSSSASWVTANQQLSGGASLTSGSPFNSCASSSNSSSSLGNGAATAVASPVANGEMAVSSTEANEQPAASQIANLSAPLKLAPEEGLLAARPLMARLAQPPSLLQLTTTNNHINSVSEMLNSSPMDPSLDLLSQHLISLQQQQQQQQQQLAQPTGFADPGTGLSLSILTSNGQTNGLESSIAASSNHLAPNSANSTPNHLYQQQQPQHQPPARHELRSSRSAGCLFRANSGASSPRTPGTPFPQAETLAGAANQNGLVGDPTSIVKLLLQVEQLKASIVHVNTLLESVVDLYKKSIDNISQ